MLREAQPTRKLVLIVEYHGGRYKGFQYQPNLPTIQHELEKAIAKISSQEVRVRGASRTDAGVHALGQVVDFETDSGLPEDTWTKALNHHLPWDIKVRQTYQPPPDFNPRRHALARTYRYTILNRSAPSPLLHDRSAWVRSPLNANAMHESAQYLVGIQDFAPFTVPMPQDKSTVRHVKRWDVWREGDLVLIEAEANAFMMHQILRTNGLLVEVGRGKAPISLVKRILKNGIMEAKSVVGLPARGLCLMKVEYAGFPPNEEN